MIRVRANWKFEPSEFDPSVSTVVSKHIMKKKNVAAALHRQTTNENYTADIGISTGTGKNVKTTCNLKLTGYSKHKMYSDTTK